MEKDHTTKVFVVSTKIFVRAEGKPNNRVCGEAARNSRACFLSNNRSLTITILASRTA